MLIKQLSVFIENKKGRLSTVTGLLRDHHIDIRALSVADTKDFGIVRLIVTDTDKALEVLKDANCMLKVSHVIGIGVADQPGGLATVMDVLREGGITVEYMYAYVSRIADTAFVILRADDNQKAAELLQAKGVQLLSSADVCG